MNPNQTTPSSTPAAPTAAANPSTQAGTPAAGAAAPVIDPNDPAHPNYTGAPPTPAFQPTPQHAAAIAKAKSLLMNDKNLIFYSVMCLSVEFGWNTGIPTACTNGLYIHINPDFFMKLTSPERISLLVHEIGHIAKSHFSRQGSRTMKRWNIAGDYVINDEIVQMGLQPIPNWYHDVKFRGFSTEEVYDMLPPDDPNDNSQDPWGDLDPNGANGPNAAAHNHKVQQSIIGAAQQAAMQGLAGNVPGDVQMYLAKLMKPKLSWQNILRQWASEKAKVDYSFSKPNRRFFPEFYLPGLDGETFGAAAIAADISGSVSDSDFTQIVSESVEIMEALNPNYIDFIQFDTEIHSVDRLEGKDDFSRLTFQGRGGTDVECVIEWANKNKPRVLLIFTDGEFYMPDVKPTCDVVWVIHDNPRFTAPYGKVIHYNINR